MVDTFILLDLSGAYISNMAYGWLLDLLPTNQKSRWKHRIN